MSIPILATKLYIPTPGHNTIPRGRLHERLDAGLSGKLILVSATAGFGKTTLVSDWVAHTQHPVAWLSLDEADNDVTRFLTYLIAALQTISPQIGAGLVGMLQSSGNSQVEAILTELLNDLSVVSDDFILVTDDYHLITTPAIDQALEFLLEHTPPQLHLVITTREDPPFALARLRAQRQLTEVRAQDLRFTSEETTGFLKQEIDHPLSPEDVAALETRTEGWIAGLQLAAISMRDTANASQFIESFTGSHHFVLDYLVEEVLSRQPGYVQAFLLRTSMLERLCGPLCEAVMGDPPGTGQTTLEAIQQANLFLIPLDNERRWYRYHHLFAELLQAHLFKQAPDDRSRLHQRASAWFEEHGFRAEAIDHALSAEDFEQAANLVERSWAAMHTTFFQSPRHLEWVQALPDDVIRKRPVLCTGCAWALLDFGELDAANARLRDAERWMAMTTAEQTVGGMVVVDEVTFQVLPAAIAGARAYLAQAFGDNASSMAHAHTVLTTPPGTDPYWHSIAASLLGLAYWSSGELEFAYQSLADGMAYLLQMGNIPFALSATVGLVPIRLAQGRLKDAEQVYVRSLKIAQQHGKGVQSTADLYAGLCEVAVERNDLQAARDYLKRSEALGVRAGLPDWPYRLSVAKATLKEAEGDFDGTLELLDAAHKLYYPTPVPNVRPVDAWKARIWVKQGQFDEAAAWAIRRGLSTEDELSYTTEFEHITLARLLIAQNNIPMTFLDRLMKDAEDSGRHGSLMEVLILQAIAAQQRDNVDRAINHLERALLLAQPEGYVRLFMSEGQILHTLLAEAAHRDVVPDYAQKLLQNQSISGNHVTNGQPLVEPLSGREIEVLQLIAEGLTNQEVADRLYLSLHTVKVHARNIYAKLDVANRTQAVARGRSLGLLPQN